ncbi:low temperature requirement protein A [Micromonospora sp. URMC 103]|uniref:low temperature requirement protein A n=1 Tax=Micromonospora sp. URMC 103 TaxID=3423406 RepID=UPI003F1972AB
MASRPERLLRRREDPVSASFLELFFDLAFVLALNQLATVLLADLTVAGALRTALLLAPIWWLWVTTTWTTDWYAPEAPVVRGLLVASTLGGLLMGVAVPAALGERAGLFVGPYLAINLGRSLFSMILLRGHPRRQRSTRIITWYAVSAPLWLAGLFVPAARVPLWVLALVVEYTAPTVGWTVPGLGRARPEELRLTGGHLSERLQQVFIISLGELVLTAGLAFTDSGTGAAHTAAFLLVFATAVLLGLLYVTPAGRALAPALDQADPTRLGADSAYLHLVMIGGVMTTAAGAELVIAHPDEAGAAFVIAAGPVVFLVGRLLLSTAINRRFSWVRLAGLSAVVVMGLATMNRPLIVVTAASTGILLVVATLDRTRTFAPG